MADANRYGTPQPRDLAMLRAGVLAIAARNGHQVEELEFSSYFDEKRDALRFPLVWTDAEGVRRSACIEVEQRAVVGKYARKVFDERLAKLFPPPPPLPPVFLDAGAGI